MTAAGQAEAEGAGAEPSAARLPSRVARLLSALFYGTCSFLIVLVNKALLTTYGFPSPIFLGIGQMAATIMILYVSKLNKIIHFPDFDKKIPVKKKTSQPTLVSDILRSFPGSLPMFTVLRKFTIPLTLLLETIVLGKQYSPSIIVSVFAIVLGAFIAAGFLLMYSTVLCSYYNSALTTAVVGAIKSLILSPRMDHLLSLFFPPFSMAGGLRYSFLTLSSQLKPKPVDEENIHLDLKS
uniref:Solute carrier family 35 member D2 n=1 Tax=Aotus nancymaae TaxID=37293 RepID=A0A2K5DKP0_AOTNA